MFSNPLYIPIVAACAVREAADHRSEMTSQLLLGEQVQVLDEYQNQWLLVKSIHDGYEGWCQKIQLSALEKPIPEIQGYFSGSIGIANVNGHPMTIFSGTPVYRSEIFTISSRISFTGLACHFERSDMPESGILRQAALAYLNTPYLWGGRTIAGIDCSGFVQMVYRQLGVHLLRDASLQATMGESIGFLQEAGCGDLVFFDDPDGRIIHVGMLMNDHEIIHAAGKVRIDDIDHEGIISRDLMKRTHHLRLIRRYLP
ncbi:C40 family peptidase [Flavihumibacter fluvii]|uniref:C40 family peptidase n=1 Tax=Flavihumibacter fluvii TaxID=2838157 RepID=UPI001BDE2E86|nr:C40 family peptidase [Flavihumibacter fluvii]ULQ53725.1 C40 family peptidase [Flavihumibacter fluvii]